MASETMERIRQVEHEAENLELAAEQRAEALAKENEQEIAALWEASERHMAEQKRQLVAEAEKAAAVREAEILQAAETAFAPTVKLAEGRLDEVATALFRTMTE